MQLEPKTNMQESVKYFHTDFTSGQFLSIVATPSPPQPHPCLWPTTPGQLFRPTSFPPPLSPRPASKPASPLPADVFPPRWKPLVCSQRCGRMGEHRNDYRAQPLLRLRTTAERLWHARLTNAGRTFLFLCKEFLNNFWTRTWCLTSPCPPSPFS